MYDPKKDLSLNEGHFDPKRDRRSVDQVGFIDLRKTFESGSIPGNATFLDEHCNGVVDPDDMLPRPKDNFERMRQMDFVRGVLKESSKGGESVTEPSTPPAQTE